MAAYEPKISCYCAPNCCSLHHDSWFANYFRSGSNVHILYNTSENINTVLLIFYLSGTACVVLTAFAYLKVFLIIRHHQNHVHTNKNAIDIDKYKKSICTILYILAIFVFSYVPFLCCALIVHISSEYGSSYGTVMTAIIHVCVVVVFSSSFLNPLIYYLRIKELRDTVKSIARKLFCKENEQ